MRIVITHTNFPLYWLPRLKVLAEALAVRGDQLFAVEIASQGTPYSFAEGGMVQLHDVEVVQLFSGARLDSLSPSQVVARLWNELERLDPNVVLAGPIAFPMGAVALRWGRSRRRPVVIMDDVRYEDVPRPFWVEFVKRRLYRNVDAMFIPAPSHAPSYEAWGVRPDRIFFGVDVVDNDFFASRADAARGDTPALRRRLELSYPFFLGVGRQVPIKNWGGLLETYRQYRREVKSTPWDLVLVGEGPERSGLERQVADQRLEGVHFKPFCALEEVCEYYALAECFILPSFGETWGLVVNEATACGLPVLVSRRCGCAEALVREGENGWTFDPNRPEELTKALLSMNALSPESRQAFGKRSQEIINEWPLVRFARGALQAIDSCRDSRQGFAALGDSLIMTLWKGRFNSI